MTFSEIDALLKDLKKVPRSPTGRLPLGDSAIERLCSPARRGFFRACQTAAQADTPWRTIPSIVMLFGHLAESADARTAAAHVAVAAAKRRWPIPHSASGTDLESIAAKFGLPLGWVHDLERELEPADGNPSATPPGPGEPDDPSPTPADTPQPGLTTVPAPVCRLRPSTCSVTVSCLLVNPNDERGVPANLHLELVPAPKRDATKSLTKSTSENLELVPAPERDLYPIPALAFVSLDPQFHDALAHAANRVKAVGLWPAGFDVRWHLVLQTGEPLPLKLRGPSLGGALLEALTELCASNPERQFPSLPPDLAVLPPYTAVSAALTDQSPDLQPVGGLLPKLWAAALRSYPPIRAVVVAPKQDLSFLKLSQHPQNPDILFDATEAARAPTIIRAPTLAKAQTLLAQANALRWAGGPPRLPDLMPDYVPRPRLVAEVERFVWETDSGYLVISGHMGRGKTTAMAELIRARQTAGDVPVFHYLGRHGDVTSQPWRIAESFYRQLLLKYALNEPQICERLTNPADKLQELLNLLSYDPALMPLGRKEVLYLEAADQADLKPGEILVPQFMRRLPARVLCVITTRPAQAWLELLQGVTARDFAALVDDTQDIREHLRRRGGRLPAPLSADLIDGITAEGDPPPWFFTVNARLEQLEGKRQSDYADARLRSDPAPWRLPPEELVAEERRRVFRLAAQPPGPVSEDQCWEILGRLAVAGADLSPSELKALGFYNRKTRKLLDLAVNFFEPRPFQPKDSDPYSFRKAGYQREFLKHFDAEGQTELHRQMASACAKLWHFPGPARDYALRHLPSHLRRAGQGPALVDLLCDLEFIAGRAELGLVQELLSEYAAARTWIAEWDPKAQADAQLERQREERLAQWSRDLVAYASRWSEARRLHEQDSDHHPLPKKRDIPFPPVIEAVRLKTEEEVEAECWRIIEQPTSQERFEAFATFARTEVSHLIKFGRRPGFCLQQAANHFQGGSVWEAAKKLLPRCEHPLLLKQPILTATSSRCGGPCWRLGEQVERKKRALAYNPVPACIGVLKEHYYAVSSVSLSADGRRAVSGSSNGKLRVWDLKGGGGLRVLVGHTGSVSSVSVSTDGRRVVSGSAEDYTARVWDLESGQCLRVLPGYDACVMSVRVSADGRWAVLGSGDCTVRVWDLETGECLRTLEGHTGWVKSVSMTPDGRWAVSGSEDGTVRVWDLETGRCLRVLEGHKSRVTSVSVSADGRQALSGSWDHTLRVWDLDGGECLQVLVGHTRFITDVSLCADGRRAVSGSEDGTVRVWDLESGQCRRTLAGHTNIVTSVSVSADGRRAVSGSWDETVRVWDLESGRSLFVPKRIAYEIGSVSVSADGRRAVSSSNDNTVRLWDLERGECLRVLVGHTDAVSSVSVSADGRRAVSGSRNGKVRVWDLESGHCLRTLEAHTGTVSGVSVSADGRWAVSWGGFLEETARVWDLETGQCRRVLGGHTCPVRSVSLSADGRRAVSGGGDQTLRVWDLESGQCLRTLEGHDAGTVASVSVSADGRRAVSWGGDQTLRVWDLESGQCLAVAILPAEKPDMAVFASFDARVIICCTSTGEVILLRLHGL